MAEAEAGAAAGAQVGGRIADRYTLLDELGRGGMARVFRARDERLQRIVALKQVEPEHLKTRHGPRLLEAFAREYRILDQLEHPRIVRVFDYGCEPAAPYYTMELLEGETLRQRLPVPARELCTTLRDIASSLALLHARGYVHRDITPRNVWCERNGRAKLLDFGAMVSVGTTSTLIGTPPYVPPELLRGEPLDARSDLFALGALAYRALVGQEAYPAFRFRDLKRLWRRGLQTTPREVGVGPELSDLVMALLSLDPAGRPATAAEAMERLCAAASIEPDTDIRSARAYLVTPPLLSRDTQLERVEVGLRRLLEARSGGTLLVEGAAQMGRTRLLHEATLQARLKGVVVLRADRASVQEGDLGLLRAVCREALVQLPSTAVRPSRADAQLLAALGSEVQRRLGVAKAEPLSGRAALSRALSALRRWLLAVCEDVPLLLALDGVERCAALGLGLIEGLAAAAARGRPLMLMLSIDTEVSAGRPVVSDRLRAEAEALALGPLSAADARRFADALFFGGDHLGDIATWLHQVSEGVPGACNSLAQYLMDAGLARYEAGRWQLPAYPQDLGLPANVHEMLQRRIDNLSPGAMWLAHSLALAYDDSRPHYRPKLFLGVDELAQLIEAPAADVVYLLGELTDARVVRQVDGRYVVAHRALADVLRSGLPVAEAQAIHRGLAQVLGRRTGELMKVVRHLQLGGCDDQALRLLRDQERAAWLTGFDEMRLALATDCLVSALSYARQQRLPREAITRLIDGVALVISVYDWSLAGLIEQDLPTMRAEAALDPTATEQRQVPPTSDWPGSDSIHPPGRGATRIPRAQRRMILSLGVLGMIHGRMHYVRRLREIRDELADLAEVSPVAAQHAAVVHQLVELDEGKELSQDAIVTALGFLQLEELPLQLRTAACGAHAHVAATYLAERGSSQAIEVAAAFEQDVPGIWIAAHVHWLGHGFLCDGRGMDEWEARAVAVPPDDIWRRRGFLMVEARLHALLGDLLALKGVLPELSAVAVDFPGWRPWQLWAQGEYQLLRGALGDARAAFEATLEQARPGEHAAFGYASQGLVLTLARAGDLQAADRCAEQGLRSCEQHGLSSLVHFDHLLALAELRSLAAERQAAHEALRSAERVCAAAPLGGIHLGRIAECGVRLSLRAEDRPLAQQYLSKLSPLYESSGLAPLEARYVRLSEEVTRGELDETVELAPPREEGDKTLAGTSEG